MYFCDDTQKANIPVPTAFASLMGQALSSGAAFMPAVWVPGGARSLQKYMSIQLNSCCLIRPKKKLREHKLARFLFVG